MRAIVLASHHRLASGMADTLDFVTGFKRVQVLDAYLDGTDAEEQVAQIMESIDPADETFVFTDMLGGSVTQRFVPYIGPNVHLICGMNLPLVLEIALMHEEPLTPEEIRSVIEAARQGLLYVNEYEAVSLEEDE